MKAPRFRLVGGAGEGAGERAKDSLARLKCPYCEVEVTPKVYRRNMHLRADCRRCGNYLRFVPHLEMWLSLVEAEDVQPSMFEATA